MPTTIVTFPHWAAIRHLDPERRDDYIKRILDGAAWRLAPEFARQVLKRDEQLNACGIERKTFRPPTLCRVGLVAFPCESPAVHAWIKELRDFVERDPFDGFS